MKRVFVTGVNGLLGTNLTHELLERGYQVKGLLRDRTRYQGRLHQNLELIEGDLFDDLSGVLERCDFVVHIAAVTVQHYLYYTNESSKKNLLLHILKEQDMDQVLLFYRTKHGADRIARNLKKKGVHTVAIYGDKSQNQRQKSLNQFKEGNVRVLLATDIAARGFDINSLKYVINYDQPNVAKTYLHRIGRSGRAGEEGTAISLCGPEEMLT